MKKNETKVTEEIKLEVTEEVVKYFSCEPNTVKV